MRIEAIKTRKMRPPQDDLFRLFEESLDKLKERSIVAVTSKVVAIHQGRCIKIEAGVERDELAKREADWYVGREVVPGEHILFTVKDGVMIASAGIDKSNASGHFILWPRAPMAAAEEIWQWLRRKFAVKQLGVLITDSRVTPLRRGTLGIALGWYGFKPLRNYIGREDIFGEKLQVTLANVVDWLAVAAVGEMGEGREQTPLVVMSDIAGVEFGERWQARDIETQVKIPLKEDLFRSMIEGVKWQRGGR